MISLHTSPLLQPGAGDSGGMNVYVRELVSALAQAGVECTTFTRADRSGLPSEVLVEPPDAWGGRAVVEWTRRLAAGERFDPAAEELVRTAEVLDRVYGR